MIDAKFDTETLRSSATELCSKRLEAWRLEVSRAVQVQPLACLIVSYAVPHAPFLDPRHSSACLSVHVGPGQNFVPSGKKYVALTLKVAANLSMETQKTAKASGTSPGWNQDFCFPLDPVLAGVHFVRRAVYPRIFHARC